MKKENLFVVSAMLMFAILCGTACQKDGSEPELPKEVSNDIIYYSPDTSKYGKCISKVNISYKYSSVMMEESSGEGARQYKTLKIRVRKGEPIQEWFCEDVSADCLGFSDCYCRDGDDNGEKYGGYYKWQNIKELTQQDIDDLITNSVTGEPERGFHIPTEDDIENLYFYLFRNDDRGACRALKINYDGLYDYFDGQFKHEDIAYIWLNPTRCRNLPLPNQKNCEWAMATWSKSKDGKMTFGYTNNADLYLNVRFMRTLKESQW